MAIRTLLDWMRWSLYGDPAARARLAADATTSTTRWEFVPGADVPGGQRYEAENSPAVCQGTIDANHAGFSGSGFCNGTNAVGAYSQLTVSAAAGHGHSRDPVRQRRRRAAGEPVVNGSTVSTVSFEIPARGRPGPPRPWPSR